MHRDITHSSTAQHTCQHLLGLRVLRCHAPRAWCPQQTVQLSRNAAWSTCNKSALGNHSCVLQACTDATLPALAQLKPTAASLAFATVGPSLTATYLFSYAFKVAGLPAWRLLDASSWWSLQPCSSQMWVICALKFLSDIGRLGLTQHP